MSSVEQAVADNLRSMSDRDLDFALNYQHLEPSMRQSMEREVSRRKYWGSKSYHTGFTSRDGSLTIPEAKQSLAERWKNVAEQEREWLDNILSAEIKFEVDKEVISSLVSNAFNMGIKSMYYKRTPPAKLGLLPAPTGFTSVPSSSDLAETIKAMQWSNRFADLDAILAADKDLQPVTSPSWKTSQSIGRAFRTGSIAAGDQTVFFDMESTFDFSKYESIAIPDGKKEHIMDNDISSMYYHNVRILDYPGMLHAEKNCITSNQERADFWKEMRGIAMQPTSTIITARAPDYSARPFMGSVSEGIEPMRPSVQPMVKHIDHLPIITTVSAASYKEFKMPKSRDQSNMMKLQMNTEYGKFDFTTITQKLDADNTKKTSEEDLADTMSLIFSTKEDA